MSQEQIEMITIDALLEKVRTKKDQGCRLVQMSATRLPDQVELTYSFDLNSRLTNLRLSLPAVETRLPRNGCGERLQSRRLTRPESATSLPDPGS